MEEGTSRRRLLRAFGATTAMVWGVSDRVVQANADARGARPDRSGAMNGTGGGLETTTTPTSGDATETPTATPTPTAANEPPTAAFSYSPAEPVAGEPIEFDASESSDPDGSILVYAWDFNGDSTVDATGRTVTHTYEEPGEYEVVMGVADDERATDRARATVEVAAAETETATPTQATPTEPPTATPSPAETPSPTEAPPSTGDGLLDGVIGQVAPVIGGGITLVAGALAAKKVVGGDDSSGSTPGSAAAVHERTGCPSCGRSLGGDEKYCTGCGYDLMGQRCPECDADLEGDEKFCTRCGHDVSG